jgi:hypothetical protein
MLNHLKLSPRDRKAVMVGASAAALFLVLNFVAFPLLGRFSRDSEAVGQEEVALRRYQRLLSETDLKKRQLAAAQERLKRLEAGLLESPSTSLANAEWQHLIGELAERRGIELGSSEFLRARNLSPEYSLLTGRVQFRCRLDQLVDFLVAMASSPKLIAVTRMTVSGPQGDPQKRFNVQLVIGAAVRGAKGSVRSDK